MTKSKLTGTIVCLICVIMTLLTFPTGVDAASETKYQNDETGYRVVIIDTIDLLTNSEERMLAEDMKPLTAYGNVVFWTTEDFTVNEIDQARLKRKELFGFDSACIFAINLNVRKLTIQSYGTINEAVNDSVARSITDNVSSYASSSDYYTCSQTAFSQILDVCEKRHISEPLKVSGYVVISLMLGLIIAISIAFSKKHNPLLEACLTQNETPYRAEGGFNGPVTSCFVESTTVHRPPASSSGGSGSGCSSCSSCSSCGGGGCGSGGSSSF
ncbi:MAG: TPM domain-containing protein [Clostridia bacterium]|nr:TPM domain-containing protein [Clostridia bacterium]